MPYVKTGRPPGRPKTKEYETLSARMPQDSVDQARDYATRHGQTLSQVLKDGLDLLFKTERGSLAMSDSIPTSPEIVSDMNGVTESLSDARHMQRLREIVSDSNEAAPAPEIVSDRNREPQEIVSDINTIPAKKAREIVSDTTSVEAQQNGQTALPSFDASKCFLGMLCRNRHDYAHSGQSLRSHAKGHECVACVRERQQRQRKSRV